MSAWGNKDSKTASGTVAISSAGAVTGSSTALTTQAAVGDYIRVASEDYLITAIASDTSATVVAGVPGATLTAVGSATAYTLSEKPKSVTTSESANSSGDKTKSCRGNCKTNNWWGFLMGCLYYLVHVLMLGMIGANFIFSISFFVLIALNEYIGS